MKNFKKLCGSASQTIASKMKGQSWRFTELCFEYLPRGQKPHQPGAICSVSAFAKAFFGMFMRLSGKTVCAGFKQK